jgi:hypothetical protein
VEIVNQVMANIRDMADALRASLAVGPEPALAAATALTMADLQRVIELWAPPPRPSTGTILVRELQSWFYRLLRRPAIDRREGPQALERVDWRYDVDSDRVLLFATLVNPRAREGLALRFPDTREARLMLGSLHPNWFQQVWRQAAAEVDAQRAAERHSELMAQMAPPPIIDPPAPAIYDKAVARGQKLLREWLSQEQRQEYDAVGCFKVIGSHTGRRYRIVPGFSHNVKELDASGEIVASLCFAPQGNLVPGDIMLAQKIALETNERAALKVANRAGLDPVVYADRRAWVEGNWDVQRIEPGRVYGRAGEPQRVEPRQVVVDSRSWTGLR